MGTEIFTFICWHNQVTPLKHLIRSGIMIALSTYLAISTVYHDQNYRLSVIKKIYKKNLQQILYFLKKSLHKATLEKPLLALPYTIKIFFFTFCRTYPSPFFFFFCFEKPVVQSIFYLHAIGFKADFFIQLLEKKNVFLSFWPKF